MSRPVASPDQQIIAYTYFRRGFSARAILKLLELNFDTPVSLRTVERWVSGFKSRGKDDAEFLDELFIWSRLDEYPGIPWEASSLMLRMTRYAAEHWPLRPTVREVRWWWRIHLALPEVTELSDIWGISFIFAQRDLLQHVLKKPDPMSDLEAMLTYSPWQSDANWESYAAAITDGWVAAPGPPIPLKGIKNLQRVSEAGNNLEDDSYVSMLGFPRWLPSRLSEGLDGKGTIDRLISFQEELKALQETSAQWNVHYFPKRGEFLRQHAVLMDERRQINKGIFDG